MHAGSAPVIRLEGPLALGHGILLVVPGSSIRAIRPPLLDCVRFRVVRRWVLQLAGAVPRVTIRVAAVSPTFGRLFEGTEQPPLGQTWSAATDPTQPSAKTCVLGEAAAARCSQRTTSTPQMTLKKPIGMQQNCWQPHGKLLASGNAVSGRNGARQQSEDGGSTSCLGDLHGLSPARRSRAVAGRLWLVYDHPVHTCV
jgi:hypothetical protein